jgi:hypothetical protein
MKLVGKDLPIQDLQATLPTSSGIPKAAGDTSIQKLMTDVRVGRKASGLPTSSWWPAIGQLNGGGARQIGTGR